MCPKASFAVRNCSVVIVSTFALLASPDLGGFSTARAEDANSTPPAARDAAARAFEDGENAYEAGDFARAASSFEQAYRALPHPASLWNAARSWERASEPARAANAYARYLREAKEDAPDRDAAGKSLAALAKLLGRIEVYAPDADEVHVDDQPLEGTRVFVHPGTHVLEARVHDSVLRRTEVLEAGEVRSVALVPEGEKAEPAPPPAPPEVEPPPPPPPRPATVTASPRTSPAPMSARNGFVAAGTLTALGVGLVVWSGMDTLAARRDFDAAPTQDKLEMGLDKQLRTNVLLGVTAGLGAVTATLGSLWIRGRMADAPSVALTPPVFGAPAYATAVWSF